MVRSLDEIYQLIHPLDLGGCRIWKSDYLRVHDDNLASDYGFFPDRELAERALEIVAFGMLGYGIVPRHDLRIYIYDTPLTFFEDDEDFGTTGSYHPDIKSIVIYAQPGPWTLEELIKTLIHEIGHYMAREMGVKKREEEFCLLLERFFPDNEDFMQALARQWRASRRRL